MMTMKRFVLFFFMLVFALNTVVLAANANACKMERDGMAAEQTMPDMPNCHMKKSNTDQKQGGIYHCKGVCFCQHIMSSHHVLPFAEAVKITYDFVKGDPAPTMLSAVHSFKTAPPYRPPISVS